MTKTGRSSGSKSNGSSNKPNNTRSYQLQFQELQDILDQESEKLIHLKSSYIQQNVAIAKENAVLKIKLNEMETKISGLIQENIAVRSHLSITQLKYKQELTDKLQDIEQNLLSRFQSILDMFQQVRIQENLPADNSPKNSLHSNILHLPPSSLPTSKDSHTINSKVSGPSSSSSTSASPSVNSTSSRKRRKSSRRQSMFVPSDFEFPVDNDPLNENIDRHNNTINGVGIIDNNESRDVLQDQDHGNVSDESINDETDFTNSIIDYSIPEENDTKKNSRLNSLALSQKSRKPLSTSSIITSSSSSSSSSVTKLNVFKDNENENINDESNDGTNNTDNTPMKHSIRPPRIKNKKRKIVDEKMPVSTYPEITSSTRRTRGKTVNYKLPSLRSKMRRPSEKFVDATTTINIKDLQVNKRKRGNDSMSKDEVVSLTSAIQTTSKKDIPQDISKVSPPSSSSSSSASSMLRETIFKKKQLIQPKSSSPLVEKDVNKKRPTSQKKKLFKHAIINDLYDDVMTESSANSSRANKSVSFRLNEEDLSVFDLIPTKTATPKTYKNSNTNAENSNLNSNGSTTGKTLRL
ncbi:similar to Saccharomyces cerevisiae YOR073W SGO1 Component of the spindle checkpoint, involved in sensing lack of tension on mitotic chromosomes [Maudiozyma saulgeensis]|uniref:Similar to Saccharomyces cerevisiae YOR073W SGO1 Component of the spindle checkpoint, involved in sensing lack of tension on mitotic chromosomes n=1 Tax=Maudiozyma saulgeensis TaxID=1789683 RepID=A0A1X7QXZ6_9SACH|nr:similar to Saccharomyces cerevisiae YOR073W SGO1 Component of the spindle checkpoint, involved in sensing lack of tension on mitotic chromosomes [Kazachstania saulgeensis]